VVTSSMIMTFQRQPQDLSPVPVRQTARTVCVTGCLPPAAGEISLLPGPVGDLGSVLAELPRSPPGGG
jgi:hypothetical protein